MIEITYHAAWRMSQRNLSQDDIDFVCRNGKRVYAAGVVAYCLTKRSCRSREETKDYDRLEGTVVLRCSKCGIVLTVYRNRRRGLKDHRSKTKYNRRVQSGTVILFPLEEVEEISDLQLLEKKIALHH